MSMGKWYDFKTSVSFRRSVIYHCLRYEDKGLSTYGAPGEQVPASAKYVMTNRLIFYSAVLEYQRQPSRQRAGLIYRIFLDSFGNRQKRPLLLRYDVQMPAAISDTVRYRFDEYNVQPGSQARQMVQGTQQVTFRSKQPDPHIFDIVTHWLEPMLQEYVESENLNFEQVGLENLSQSMSETARLYIHDLIRNLRDSQNRLMMNAQHMGVVFFDQA
jgi:hypothetical protein